MTKMLIFFSIICAAVLFAQDDQKKPCSAPECRQFDFWTGQWDLTWLDKNGKEMHGSNTITAILDSCAIQEQFDGNPAMSFRGMSLSVYDTKNAVWRQTWVDNNGGYLDFTGGLQENSMVLSRKTLQNGKEVWQRMRWYEIRRDALKWDWEISDDGGETWQLRWRIYYKRAQ